MPRHQFSLKTLLWLMIVVAAWCMTCRTILSQVRDPIIRTASVSSLVVATVGIGCMANAARMRIGQDWQRGAAQAGWAMLGIAMLVFACILWFAGFHIFRMANAG